MPIRVTLRRFGCVAALQLLIYRLLQRWMVFDVTHLLQLDLDRLPETPERDGFQFRRLGRAEFDQLASEPSHGLDPGDARRLTRGMDICFAAFDNNVLAGYCWLALHSIEAVRNRGGVPESGVALSFGPGSIFTYQAWIHPDYRGRRLYEALVVRSAGWARQRFAVRQMISTADWTNFAALRSCQRQGLRSVGLIWRLGWRGRLWTLVPRAAAVYGIRSGPRAAVIAR